MTVKFDATRLVIGLPLRVSATENLGMDSIDTHPTPLDVPRDRRTPKKSRSPRPTPDHPRHFQRWTDTMPAPEATLAALPTVSRPERRLLRTMVVIGVLAFAVYSLVRIFRH